MIGKKKQNLTKQNKNKENKEKTNKQTNKQTKQTNKNVRATYARYVSPNYTVIPGQGKKKIHGELYVENALCLPCDIGVSAEIT